MSSALVQRAAAGDLAAAEELRAVLSEGPRDVPLWSGKADARRRRMPSLEESTGKSGDDLFVKVLTNWLSLSGPASELTLPPLSSPPPAELVFTPMVEMSTAEAGVEKVKGRRLLRMPWRHRGQKHRGLG